jgi:hypothetical protein
MSSLPNKKIKSVVLTAGETFSLPAGAKLIASDNEAALDSTCTIPTLESLQCYVIVFGNAGDEGANSQLFETNSGATPLVGLRFNNQFYAFSSAIGASPSTQMWLTADVLAAINGTAAGTLFFNPVGTNKIPDNNPSEASQHGVMYYLVFQTTATIADSLSLVLRGTAPGFYQANVEMDIRPRLRTAVSDFPDLPNCPSVL